MLGDNVRVKGLGRLEIVAFIKLILPFEILDSTLFEISHLTTDNVT